MDTLIINPLVSDGESVLIRLTDVPDDWAVREYDIHDKWVIASEVRSDHHPFTIFEAKPFDSDVSWEWSDAGQPPYDATAEPAPTA
jgi:hypothetical protein